MQHEIHRSRVNVAIRQVMFVSMELRMAHRGRVHVHDAQRMCVRMCMRAYMLSNAHELC